MPDNDNAVLSASTFPPTAKKNSKPVKMKSAPKIEYGSMRFRLPKPLERIVRYASFELEDNPKSTFKTPQAIVEEGTRRYIDFLSKHIDFPPGMLPNSKPGPDKDGPAS